MHPNFPIIMKEVFYLNKKQISELVAEQIAEQESAETIEAVGVEDEKLTLTLLTLVTL